MFATIERFADLRSKGVISDDEFANKKAELLGRI
ncbi:SHOCT domain-containing protein [Variovorax sp. J22R115]